MSCKFFFAKKNIESTAIFFGFYCLSVSHKSYGIRKKSCRKEKVCGVLFLRSDTNPWICGNSREAEAQRVYKLDHRWARMMKIRAGHVITPLWSQLTCKSQILRVKWLPLIHWWETMNPIIGLEIRSVFEVGRTTTDAPLFRTLVLPSVVGPGTLSSFHWLGSKR